MLATKEKEFSVDALLEKAQSVVEGAQKLFAEEWNGDSLWQMCVDLVSERDSLWASIQRPNDLSAVFFLAVLRMSDMEVWQRIDVSLQEIQTLLGVPGQPASSREGAKKQYPAEWNTLGKKLGLTLLGYEQFFGKVNNLTAEKQRLAIGQLNQLAVAYGKCKPFFELQAATMLYVLPADTPGTLAEWNEMTKKEDIDKQSATITPATMRFLGQSFFGNEPTVAQPALAILDNWSAQAYNIKNIYYQLLFQTLVFIVFGQFAFFSEQEQDQIMNKYAWCALQRGVLVGDTLQSILAEAPRITDYIKRSGTWAEQIRQSKEPLSVGVPAVGVVGAFIEFFLKALPDKEFDEAAKRQWIEGELSKNNLGSTSGARLLELLNLYLHLREGDLLDYRGLLSDQNIVQPYDWKKIIAQPISEIQQEEIRRSLQLVHRPLRTKMAMIVAFESVPWNEEPYIGQVLVLNNIFEEVYNHEFGTLVIFDESSGKWALDKQLPKPWPPFGDTAAPYIFV